MCYILLLMLAGILYYDNKAAKHFFFFFCKASTLSRVSMMLWRNEHDKIPTYGAEEIWA